MKKTLGALASVLSWAMKEQYITSNPALGITVRSGGHGGNEEERRLPYSAEDLTKLFAVKRAGSANHWLPYLALYTGARLEELGQLRTADVREQDGVVYLAIEPGDGKRVKTRSSKRRVPVHPALVKLDFLAFVEGQRADGQTRLFPELKGTKFSPHGGVVEVLGSASSERVRG